MGNRKFEEHMVTYEVRVKQKFYPEDYAHLDVVNTETMIKSEIEHFEEGGVGLEELLGSTNGDCEVKFIKVEPAREK